MTAYTRMLLLRSTLIQLMIAGFSLGLNNQKELVFPDNDDKSFNKEVSRSSNLDGLLADGAATENEDDNCGLMFDSATNFRDELYFIKGIKYWRVRANYQVFPGTEIRHLWRGFPTNISKVDAVFTVPEDQSIVFISGDSYWRLADPRDEPTQKSLSTLGVRDHEKIRAAFVWGVNERIYLIGTKKYWKLSQDFKPEIGYPKDVSAIKGLPSNLNGAFEDFDRQVYFIQGGKAWKLNNNKLQVERENATSISAKWLACTSEVVENLETTTASHDKPASTTTGGAAYKKLDIAILGCAFLAFVFFVVSTAV